MLKKRLIPVLFIKNGLIVRSESFSLHQNIGNVVNQTIRYSQWDIDELIYIDISKTPFYSSGREEHAVPNYSSINDIIKSVAKVSFMPLTFGGGIRTIEQIDMFVREGADKIILNTGAINNHQLISKSALKFGSQCIVISIDYRVINNKPYVFSDSGQVNTNIELYEWIRQCENLGAGEIFINSIDRDGKANGYDMEIIQQSCQVTNLPLIACGGAGDFYDFLDLANETNVSGIAAGNIFHFTENSYPRAKKLLKREGVNVR